MNGLYNEIMTLIVAPVSVVLVLFLCLPTMPCHMQLITDSCRRPCVAFRDGKN